MRGQVTYWRSPRKVEGQRRRYLYWQVQLSRGLRSFQEKWSVRYWEVWNHQHRRCSNSDYFHLYNHRAGPMRIVLVLFVLIISGRKKAYGIAVVRQSTPVIQTFVRTRKVNSPGKGALFDPHLVL